MTTGGAAPSPDRRTPRASAIAIVHRLQRDGRTAYLAGGCVRDELLGLHPQDYDVATDAPPDRVAELFSRTRAVGKSFGVMLVTHSGSTIEVATFRAEGPYSDRRRPDAVRFATPEEDAQRRDFTINALFIDPLDPKHQPDGRVIDFVGGQADLAARVIRAVGDADARLAEDHLRALRAVRFAGRLGFTIDPPTADAITRHATELAGVSRERIGDELRRMMADPNRAQAIALLHRLGLDGPTLTELCLPDRNAQTVAALPDAISFAGALVAWAIDRAAIDHPMTPQQADHIATDIGSRWRSALCLTNDEREAFSAIARGVAALEGSWAGWGVAPRKRAGGALWFAAALRIVAVRSPDLARAISADRDALASTPGGLAPEPLVVGDHLIAAGLRPGPRFGPWLERLYDLQLEGKLASTDAGIALVREWSAAKNARP